MPTHTYLLLSVPSDAGLPTSHFCTKALWVCSHFYLVCTVCDCISQTPSFGCGSFIRCQWWILQMTGSVYCRKSHCEKAKLCMPEILQHLNMQLKKSRFLIWFWKEGQICLCSKISSWKWIFCEIPVIGVLFYVSLGRYSWAWSLFYYWSPPQWPSCHSFPGAAWDWEFPGSCFSCHSAQNINISGYGIRIHHFTVISGQQFWWQNSMLCGVLGPFSSQGGVGFCGRGFGGRGHWTDKQMLLSADFPGFLRVKEDLGFPGFLCKVVQKPSHWQVWIKQLSWDSQYISCNRVWLIPAIICDQVTPGSSYARDTAVWDV